jgi:hypothetical protein
MPAELTHDSPLVLIGRLYCVTLTDLLDAQGLFLSQSLR